MTRLTVEAITTEVQRGLGRVEGKLDYLLTIIPDHFKSDEESFDKLANRISKLEVKVYTLAGSLGVFSGIASSLISHFLTK